MKQYKTGTYHVFSHNKAASTIIHCNTKTEAKILVEFIQKWGWQFDIEGFAHEEY